MGDINRDAAYVARKPGGHGLVCGGVEPPMTSLDERAYTNAGPVNALTPKKIADIADKTGTVTVALTPFDISLAFTPKATATAIVRYVLIGPGLPTGVTLAAATGVVSGTPAAGQAGVYNFQACAECDVPEAVCFSNRFSLTIV